MTIQHLITRNGVTDNIEGWAKRVGISRQALSQRLKNGWTEEEAVAVGNSVVARNKARKLRVNSSNRAALLKHQADSAALTAFEQVKDQQLALQRHFNSILRQFNRDLNIIMARSMARGVVADLSKSANDRSTRSTQDSV